MSFLNFFRRSKTPLAAAKRKLEVAVKRHSEACSAQSAAISGLRQSVKEMTEAKKEATTLLRNMVDKEYEQKKKHETKLDLGSTGAA